MKRRYPAKVRLTQQDQSYLTRFAESPRTQATIRTALEAFTVFRAREARRVGAATPLLPLEVLDLDVLVDFKNWLQERGYAAFSRDTYVTLIGMYLAYAQDQEWLADGFSVERAKYRYRDTHKRRSYPIPKISPALPNVIHYFDKLALPEDDAEDAALERLNILRGRAIMQTLYSCAGRVSEVASLTRKSVQDGRRNEAEVVGKGDKERFLRFVPEAQAAIQAYLAERRDAFEPVFIYHERKMGKAMSRQSIWALVHETAKALGAGDISPHDFRHYRARQMLKEGAPLEMIQEILGHSDIGTTRRVYAHFDEEAVRDAFQRTYIPASQIPVAED